MEAVDPLLEEGYRRSDDRLENVDALPLSEPTVEEVEASLVGAVGDVPIDVERKVALPASG